MPLISRLPSGGGGKKSIILADNVYTVSVSSYDNRLVINWVKPTNSESPIKEYNFYWVASDSKPTSLKQFTNKVTLSNSATSYTLTGLTTNQRYYIAIESVNEDGYENASLRNVVTEKASVPYFVIFQNNNNGNLTNGYGSTDGKTWVNLGSSNIASVASSSNTPPYGRIYYTTNDFFTMPVGNNPAFVVEFRKGSVTYTNAIQAVSNISSTFVNAKGKTLFGVNNVIYYKNDGATSFVMAATPVSASNITPYLSYCNGYYFWAYCSSYLTYQNYRSSDGINWEFACQTSNAALANFKSTNMYSMDENIVYFNNKYMTPSYYSNDGKTWIRRHPTNDGGNEFIAIIVFKNKVYVSRGGNTIYASDNGVDNFTRVSISLPSPYSYMYYGLSKNDVLVGFGYYSNGSRCLMYSVDGITFVSTAIVGGYSIGVNTVLT